MRVIDGMHRVRAAVLSRGRVHRSAAVRGSRGRGIPARCPAERRARTAAVPRRPGSRRGPDHPLQPAVVGPGHRARRRTLGQDGGVDPAPRDKCGNSALAGPDRPRRQDPAVQPGRGPPRGQRPHRAESGRGDPRDRDACRDLARHRQGCAGTAAQRPRPGPAAAPGRERVPTGRIPARRVPPAGRASGAAAGSQPRGEDDGARERSLSARMTPMILESLRNDPSLRYNETGRVAAATAGPAHDEPGGLGAVDQRRSAAPRAGCRPGCP